MTQTIKQPALVEVVSAGSVRALRAVESGNGKYALVAQIGLGERTLATQRNTVRTWADLNTLARYTRETLGINRFEVVGQ